MGQITLTLHGKFTMYARYYYDKNPIYFTNETDPDDPICCARCRATDTTSKTSASAWSKA